MSKIRINEAQLKRVVAENVKKILNEAYDINKGTGAYEAYAYFRAMAAQGDKGAEAKANDLIKNHHYEICEQLAWMFDMVFKEAGYTNADINRISETYIKRIETFGDEEEENLRNLGQRYLSMLDDNDLSFVDTEELGLCLFEVMKKYCAKYRAKLDNNNRKRQTNKNIKMNKKQTISLNESELRKLIAESVRNALLEAYSD